MSKDEPSAAPFRFKSAPEAPVRPEFAFGKKFPRDESRPFRFTSAPSSTKEKKPFAFAKKDPNLNPEYDPAYAPSVTLRAASPKPESVEITQEEGPEDRQRKRPRQSETTEDIYSSAQEAMIADSRTQATRHAERTITFHKFVKRASHYWSEYGPEVIEFIVLDPNETPTLKISLIDWGVLSPGITKETYLQWAHKVFGDLCPEVMEVGEEGFDLPTATIEIQFRAKQ